MLDAARKGRAVVGVISSFVAGLAKMLSNSFHKSHCRSKHHGKPLQAQLLQFLPLRADGWYVHPWVFRVVCIVKSSEMCEGGFPCKRYGPSPFRQLGRSRESDAGCCAVQMHQTHMPLATTTGQGAHI